MKNRYLLFLLIVNPLFYACKTEIQKRNFERLKIDEIKIDSTSIRAIYVLKDSTLFYATSNGEIGMTLGLDNKHIETKITYDTIVPNFRSIASNGQSLFVLSVGNPALLFKYLDGDSKIVYTEEHEKVFYDSMAFFDEQNGIAMGDPTDDCLSIILTNDGGETWTKIPCSNLPKTEDGEAAFAASNTNIAVIGSDAWLATGGKRARVFHTPDKGLTWKVYETPITQGGKMTGIYSIDFYDSMNGIIFGGNWEDKNNTVANKAITIDGGKTWKLIADGQEPGYKSCVQYVPDTHGKELFAVSSNGTSFSNDSGYSWKEVSSEKDFYTIKFVNKNMAWLAGKNKIGKLILE
jgi:photosystem II stability/assembly factor-like uncharacterized protein